MNPTDTTAEWYFADDARQQHGPVSHAELLSRLQQGLLHADSLVWKPGMAAWQPAQQALGLPGHNAPEPVAPPPPAPSVQPVQPVQSAPVPAATAIAATPAAAPVPPAPAAPVAPHGAMPSALPPAKNKNGCLIAALIAGVALFLAIPVMGILAAIAIPAYHDYVQRSKITQVKASLASYQAIVADFYGKEGRCPQNGEAGIPERDAFPEPHITDVYVGVDTDEDAFECVIAPTLTGFGNTQLDNQELWLAYDADNGGQWQCGGTPPQRIMPTSCRQP